jgi:hypothetical protein
MSKIYVDEILPKDNAKITAANLQLPAGSVIQVVTAQNTTNSSITSTGTWVATQTSASITPTSASNKILVIVNDPMHGDCDGDGQNEYAGWRLYRDSTVLRHFVYNGTENLAMITSRAGQNAIQSQTITYLDSPSTTSQVTYSTYVNRSALGNRSLRVNWNGTASITLMEIAQ